MLLSLETLNKLLVPCYLHKLVKESIGGMCSIASAEGLFIRGMQLRWIFGIIYLSLETRGSVGQICLFYAYILIQLYNFSDPPNR